MHVYQNSQKYNDSWLQKNVTPHEYIIRLEADEGNRKTGEIINSPQQFIIK